jgi:hypothetical protein
MILTLPYECARISFVWCCDAGNTTQEYTKEKHTYTYQYLSWIFDIGPPILIWYTQFLFCRECRAVSHWSRRIQDATRRHPFAYMPSHIKWSSEENPCEFTFDGSHDNLQVAISKRQHSHFNKAAPHSPHFLFVCCMTTSKRRVLLRIWTHMFKYFPLACRGLAPTAADAAAHALVPLEYHQTAYHRGGGGVSITACLCSTSRPLSTH